MFPIPQEGPYGLIDLFINILCDVRL